MAYTPYSYVQLKADGATTNFPFNFPYLDTAHIQVSVDTVVTDFTWVDSYTVKIASAPVAGAVVEIRRITPKDSAIVSFQDGSTLLEADLDLMVTYNLYCAQEAYDGTQASIHLTADGVWDGQSVRATDFADPVDAQDLMTLNYMNVNFKNTMLAIEQDAVDKVSAYQSAASANEASAAQSASEAAASQSAAATSQVEAKASETNAANSAEKAAGYAASLNLPSASGEALRVLRQNASASGLEYGPPVQTDVLDTTAGALLALGAFGLGSPGGLPALTDIDARTTPPGWYKWSGGTGTAPSTFGVVLVAAHNGELAANNWAFQVFFSTDGYVSWRMAINSGAWGTWLEIRDTGNFTTATYQQALGFTPVQQGTGINQESNVVKIGWSGNDLLLTVDSTDEGAFVTSINLGTKLGALAVGAVGTYGLFIVGGSGALVPGSTVAGANLKWSATGWGGSVVPDGTWQLMGQIQDADGGGTNSVTVCMRIA